VRRAIGKNDEEVAVAMMLQIKDRWNPIEPPEISSDGNDGYPEAMLGTWGSCLNMLEGKYIQLENNRNLDGNVSKSPRLHLGERLTIVRRSTKH